MGEPHEMMARDDALAQAVADVVAAVVRGFNARLLVRHLPAIEAVAGAVFEPLIGWMR